MNHLQDILESGCAPGFQQGAKHPTHAEMAIPRALREVEQQQGTDKLVRGMGWKPTHRNINAIKKCWGMGVIAFFLALSSFGESVKVPTTVSGTGRYTNSLVVRTPGFGSTNAPVKLYSIMGYNSTNTTIYLQVYQQTSVPANAATNFVIGPFPIPATNFYYVDFNLYGADLDGATVVMSTTPGTNTIATACATIQSIWTIP